MATPPKKGEWKSVKTSKSTKYKTWNGTSWVGNSTVQPKGRKYQPDGYNDPYEDYNPVLEEATTIKTDFGNYGAQIAGAGGSVELR